MSHRALRLLGAFTVGDHVVFTPDEPDDDQGPAEVLEAEYGYWFYIRFRNITWHDGMPVHRWAKKRQLCHERP